MYVLEAKAFCSMHKQKEDAMLGKLSSIQLRLLAEKLKDTIIHPNRDERAHTIIIFH